MARMGVFCFAGAGHLYPMTALARRLEERGHEVVFFGIADTEEKVHAAGMKFVQIGARDYPKGTLAALDKRLGELKGLKTFAHTVERVKNTTQMVLRDGPRAVREAGVAARVVAVAIPRRKLTVDRVRHAVRAVLEEERYRVAARRVQTAMAEVDRPARAADMIEKTLGMERQLLAASY